MQSSQYAPLFPCNHLPRRSAIVTVASLVASRMGHVHLYGSPEISGRECGFLSGPGFDSRPKLWMGRRRTPGDRADRADQAGVGGEPVPRHLAGVHDVGEAPKYRVGEPVAAQIVPNPLDWIELRTVGRQR